MLKDIFRDYMQKYTTECSSFEETEMLVEEAKERAVAYIENLRKMTFDGSEKLELHSTDFWDRYVTTRESQFKFVTFFQNVHQN